jgi:hypothetical protein
VKSIFVEVVQSVMFGLALHAKSYHTSRINIAPDAASEG